jgi:hypothetical protein
MRWESMVELQHYSSLGKNTVFRKLDLFPSSNEGGGREDTYSIGIKAVIKQ